MYKMYNKNDEEITSCSELDIRPHIPILCNTEYITIIILIIICKFY